MSGALGGEGGRPALRLEGGTVVAHGLPAAELTSLRALGQADWQRRFVVTVAPGDGPEARRQVAPMLGLYQVEDGLVRFSPSYPLLEGQRYRARFGGEEAVLEVARQPRQPTRLLRISPSAQVVPENLLRFYLYFSAPMREGEALEHVRLIDEIGHPVQGVFLDTLSELWDTSGTRLALLLDPGRVKTGLVAHEQLGRALRAGGRYRLEVAADWRDAHGAPLAGPVVKEFRAGPAAVSVPDGAAWRLSVPSAREGAALTIRFPAPVDPVQAALFIQVRGPQGGLVLGEVALEEEETLWRFVSSEPWQDGTYAVEVNERLEDLAGNNLCSLFDAPAGKPQARGSVSLPFVIRDCRTGPEVAPGRVIQSRAL